MPVPDDAPAAVVGLQIGGRGQKLGHFRFDRLGQKRPRPIAQNLGQPVGQNLWLNQFDNVIVGHGISLFRWRSGGSNAPTICRLPQFTPSPTFGNSSGPLAEAEFEIFDEMLQVETFSPFSVILPREMRLRDVRRSLIQVYARLPRGSVFACDLL